MGEFSHPLSRHRGVSRQMSGNHASGGQQTLSLDARRNTPWRGWIKSSSRLCHIWTPPVLQAGFTTVRAGLLSYIRLRDGTVFVPSLDGFRAAAPMHPDGLMGQPMTRLRFCCCGGDPVRPSVGVSCYAILGKLFSVFVTRPRTFL